MNREQEEHFIDDLKGYDRRAGNILERYGFTLETLRKLSTVAEPDYVVQTLYTGSVRTNWHNWMELLDIRTFGPVTMLQVVNFCRLRHVELHWFAEWDWYSANWVVLSKHERVPKGYEGT